MEDQEETLVLNYLVEDLSTPMETDAEAEEPEVLTGLNESLDENQNPKIVIKEETVEATPQKAKNLMIVLERRELTPKRLEFSNKSNKQNFNSSSSKKRKIVSQSLENGKKIVGNKINGSKSPISRNLESKSLKRRPLEYSSPPKNSKSYDENANSGDTIIKVENPDEDDIFSETPVNNNVSTLGNMESEDIDIKYESEYESVQQIHTEFKYESLSETEENIRKKKEAIAAASSKKAALKIPKKAELIKKQSTLDKYLKIMDQKTSPKQNLKPNQTKLDKYFRTVDKKSGPEKNLKPNVKPKCKLPTINTFKCDQCLYVGNSRANLERHSLIHMDPSEILWYKCTECEYKSKYEDQLKGHTLIHKNPDELEYFQCPHCELKCTRKHNLNNHIRSIHADRVNSFRCANCDYSTFSKDRLAAHIRTHSKAVFTCNLCKFVTKRKEYLASHFKYKHTEVDRPFPCDTCSYKGKSKRELDRHYDRMHNKEKLRAYLCNHCDFTSIYKKNLEFHLLHMHKNSEGFQKFICGHCNKDFAYKNGLKTHIVRMHLRLTDDDWHKCQECKYKCKDVSTLKRHIKRNHGAPRLHCKQCSFATNRQKSMAAHMKTHEVDVDQILKCPECPYRFIQGVSFVYHMKVLHGKPMGFKDLHRYYLVDD